MTNGTTENKPAPRALSVLLKEHTAIEGETAAQFMAEMKKLTTKDRADLTAEFEKMGIPVKETTPVAPSAPTA
jgi:phage FluMu protein gp41